VRRQIESHRNALTTGGQRLAVEGIGCFGSGETGVLTDGPRLDRVHRRLRAAQIGRNAGQGVGELEVLDILLCIQRLDRKAFRGIPDQITDITTRRLLGRSLFPNIQVIGIKELFRHEIPLADSIFSGR
jgi:hypothetical protein